MRRVLAVLALLLSPALFAQTIDSAAVDRLARDTMARWKVPSMTVAIVQNDRVTYIKGFNATPDTLFQIGSATKAFTTTAMAMLVDEKKMNWDDPVRKSIEYFHLSDPCADSLVTLRDIVSHRTGLSRHDEIWDYTSQSREQVIRDMASVKLTKPFRSAYQYNNIMLMTAGEAVASAAKMPWSDFVKTRIFDPLGMSETVVSEAGWLKSNHVIGYRYDAAHDAVVPENMHPYESLAPAGTIKSSAHDMAQWVRFQLNDGAIDGKKLVSAAALNETKKPQTLLDTDETTQAENPESNINTYAMAWRVQDYRGTLLVSHGGALNGFRAQVDLLPKQKAGFVVLVNVGRGYATIAMRNALLDMLLGVPASDWNAYYLALDAKSRADELKHKQERDAKLHKDTMPSRELAAYAGTYDNPAEGPAVVTVEGDHLVLTFGRLRLPMTHYQFDTFEVVSDEEELDELVPFALGTGGEVKSLTLFGDEFQ
ncbi:MAG TPA: serine hydrolase, partial [Thermoanaerobaculia bacterium]|nr:serine hydrolase [Thermoanaerobaculia bacterium]